MLARAHRWLRGELPFVTVLVLMLAGLVYLMLFPRHWRPGAGLMSVAMLSAGALRLVLPVQYAGLLMVRSRWLDTVCYVVMGGVILGVTIRLH